MGIYKTYKEAVLADGSVKGVFTDGKRFYTDGTDLKYCDIKPCNPADHLESLAFFTTKGLELVDGDMITGVLGGVLTVGVDVNLPLPVSTTRDATRFVIYAAAHEIETPEEKEAFDAIDTTPSQVESLSGSGKPNDSEWKNGDVCVCGSGLPAKIIGPMPSHPSKMAVEVQDTLGARVKIACINDLEKPETPAEREDRERLDAAYDLYCEFTRVNAPASTPKTFERWKSMLSVEAWLAVADKKADHRKQ